MGITCPFQGNFSMKTLNKGTNRVVKARKSIRKFRLAVVLSGPVCFLALTACTHESERPQGSCAYADWYEAGRSDGNLGLPMSRLEQHQKRCDATRNPVNVDL